MTHPRDLKKPPRLARSTAQALVLALGWAAGSQPAGGAESVQQITWLSGYRSAHDVNTAELQMATQLLQFMAKALPQVQFNPDHSNARRAWQQIADGAHVCQPSSVRTPEREKIAYFTDTLLGPPLQLIARRDKLAELPHNAAGEIDLAALLADQRTRGALVDGRSYGRVVDQILAQNPSAQGITRYASSDFGSQILAMLALSRADWSIGYDTSLSESQREDPQLRQLTSHPIAGATEMVRAGVACPRTPWGLAAIRSIDRALGTPAGAAMLKEQALYWLTPEARQHYAAQFDAFYRERAKPSVIR